MKFKKLMLTVAAASTIGVAAPKTTVAANSKAVSKASKAKADKKEGVSGLDAAAITGFGLGAAGAAGAAVLWKTADNKLAPTRSGGVVAPEAAQNAALMRKLAIGSGAVAAVAATAGGVRVVANRTAHALTADFNKAVDGAKSFAIVGEDKDAKKANAEKAVELVNKAFEIEMKEADLKALLKDAEVARQMVKACPELAPLVIEAKKDEEAIAIRQMAGLAKVVADAEAVANAERIAELEKAQKDARAAADKASKAKEDDRAAKLAAKKAEKVKDEQKAFDDKMDDKLADYVKAVKAADKAKDAAAEEAMAAAKKAAKEAAEKETAEKITLLAEDDNDTKVDATHMKKDARDAAIAKAGTDAETAKETELTDALTAADKEVTDLVNDKGANDQLDALNKAKGKDVSAVKTAALDADKVKAATEKAKAQEDADKALDAASVKAGRAIAKYKKAEAKDSKAKDSKATKNK